MQFSWPLQALILLLLNGPKSFERTLCGTIVRFIYESEEMLRSELPHSVCWELNHDPNILRNAHGSHPQCCIFSVFLGSQLLLAAQRAVINTETAQLCWTWPSPPLTVGCFTECWQCKPSVLLNRGAYSLLSNTGGLENTSLLSGPLWPVEDKDTNLIFKACCGFDLSYTTGPSCLHNHRSLTHQDSCIILCIHKLKKKLLIFFFLAMPDLSSEYTENNHDYSFLLFTCSYLARRGRNAAYTAVTERQM